MPIWISALSSGTCNLLPPSSPQCAEPHSEHSTLRRLYSPCPIWKLINRSFILNGDRRVEERTFTQVLLSAHSWPHEEKRFYSSNRKWYYLLHQQEEKGFLLAQFPSSANEKSHVSNFTSSNGLFIYNSPAHGLKEHSPSSSSLFLWTCRWFAVRSQSLVAILYCSQISLFAEEIAGYLLKANTFNKSKNMSCQKSIFQHNIHILSF